MSNDIERQGQLDLILGAHLRARFFGPDGACDFDPLKVAPTPYTVDTSGAALLLAQPALEGEFLPASLWAGTSLLRPQPLAVPAQGSSRDMGDWCSIFHSAVERACGDAECIGVSLSGGLDSLAVLVQAIQLNKGSRRIVAFTHDMRADHGGSAAQTARTLLRQLDLDCEHVVLEETERAEPPWSPRGPRLDAAPAANAAVSERAAQLGVGVLLSGDGADEVVGTPRYATAEIARRYGLRASYQYLRDASHVGPSWPGELLALGTRPLPRSLGARLYWATNWPDNCSPRAPRVIGSDHRHTVTQWSREYLNQQLTHHTAHIHSGWARADAWDAIWPHDPLLPAGTVPERSPFLDEQVMQFVHGLDLAYRYDPAAPHAYHRYKSLVIRLYPLVMRAALPTRKQYFHTALDRSAARRQPAERAIAAGILDPAALERETDTATLLNVDALEQWLAGAQERGVAIPGMCSPSPGFDHR